MEMKDSGERQQFEGGAQRDTAKGKPVMHLLSPHIIDVVYGDWHLQHDIKFDSELYKALQGFWLAPEQSVYCLKSALDVFLTKYGVKQLADWLELGSKKYDKWNWAHGMYFTRVWDSLGRHLLAIKEGLTDELHGAAAMCNLMFLIHYIEEIKAGRLDPKWDDRFDFNLYKKEPDV